MIFLPDISTAAFNDSATVDNPYFPLLAGTVTSHTGSLIDPESGETDTESNDFYATAETATIAGIEAVVVRDTAYENGVMIEDTLDWYAQDDAGNVWYLGEFTIAYEYDDDGEFTGTSFEGSWEAGVDGAQPGWIMKAAPATGEGSYYQEFFPGVAEDVGEVLATDVSFGPYSNIVQTLDTSAIDPGIIEFKYYAPGVGQVRVEEEIDEFGVPQLVFNLDGMRTVDGSAPVDPTDLAFGTGGDSVTVTFLTEDGDENSAIGGYFFDSATGEIGEGRILFANTEDTAAGDSVTLDVPAGMSLGLFLIPGADDLGVELEDFAAGGLFFQNFATAGAANINDGLAPLITNAEGEYLPIRAFHTVGNRAGVNLLNPVGGENALASDVGDAVPDAQVVSFEDGLASRSDYDGDFDDALIAISDAPLSDDDIADLLDAADISRIVGTDCDDRLTGTDDDDQIVGLDGNDRIYGRDGDDVIESGDGNDYSFGNDGDDEISGEEGDDHLYGREGDDTLDGGEGNDQAFGGDGDDLLEGGEGNDKLWGGDGFDFILGGEGNDMLTAGDDGARMSGGEGNDSLYGSAGWADQFVFDLIPFGADRIKGFEDGLDVIEIAGYTGATSFDDIAVDSVGCSTVLTFAEGSVLLRGFDAELVDASDFVFV